MNLEMNFQAMPLGAAYPHLGAFESTRLVGTGTDVLETTRHIERWHFDLELLRQAGISELRYSVPWHRIERKPGTFDFSWFDGPMAYFQVHGMRPILDPIHHVSFPDWLEQGFANPDFAMHYERFILELAQRYPWVDCYTIFNEPLPTTVLCALTGDWYPHQASEDCFVRMAINVGKSICLASRALLKANPRVQLMHVESAEVHWPLDRESENWVQFANCRRFLLHDLILGSITRSHELYSYLRRHGFSDDDMLWFQNNRTRIDVLGLDYYAHSEIDWYWDKGLGRANIAWPVIQPAGFAILGKAYADRFRLPVFLGETNIRGSYLDRLTWLKFMEEQCETLSLAVDFRGFYWYPSIDSTDWCHLCTKATGIVDPQGIWGLDDQRWHREASELSQMYSALARGLIRSEDLPAYEFSAATGGCLGGYERLMAHWPERRTQDELTSA
jgi:beta-glucosidase